MQKTLPLKEAAAPYGLKPSTLRLMCVRGQVKYAKPGKLYYVDTADLARVMET